MIFQYIQIYICEKYGVEKSGFRTFYNCDQYVNISDHKQGAILGKISQDYNFLLISGQLYLHFTLEALFNCWKKMRYSEFFLVKIRLFAFFSSPS